MSFQARLTKRTALSSRLCRVCLGNVTVSTYSPLDQQRYWAFGVCTECPTDHDSHDTDTPQSVALLQRH